jgi:hypothetical protein
MVTADGPEVHIGATTIAGRRLVMVRFQGVDLVMDPDTARAVAADITAVADQVDWAVELEGPDR